MSIQKLSVLAVLVLSTAHAESSASTGSVEGYVTAADTNLPLRFAEIRLVPKPADHADPKPHLMRVVGGAGIDGRFRVDDVPAGDYLAGAIMSGYITHGMLPVMVASEDQMKRLLASMPLVHVASGQVARVHLTLERGAVIAGRIQFADGSPAIGLTVQWELPEVNLAVESVRMARFSPTQETVMQFDFSTEHTHGVSTDDMGHYRIPGLVPGNYIVSTIVFSQIGSTVSMSDGSSPSSNSIPHAFPETAVVYLPGSFRRTGAKIIAIHGAEQITNADLKIEVTGLHTLRGRVVAGADRHAPGQALLRLTEDGVQDVGRHVESESDGSFQIHYLPAGHYTLELVSARDLNNGPPSYTAANIAVTVSDHDVVVADMLANPKR